MRGRMVRVPKLVRKYIPAILVLTRMAGIEQVPETEEVLALIQAIHTAEVVELVDRRVSGGLFKKLGQ